MSEQGALSRLGVGPNVRLACQLHPSGDLSVLPLLPADIQIEKGKSGHSPASETERSVAILFVDIRRSTAIVEKRLPYDVVFLLNHFFEAVAGAVVEAGGKPNQFLGDGMMAIFGTEVSPQVACRQALEAAVLIEMRLARMNDRMRYELQEPISIGIGIHTGTVILGELGYREHSHLTAIGESVHVAARLQDLTKEYKALLVVSDDVLKVANVPAVGLPSHEVRVRGRDTPLTIHSIEKLDSLDLAGQTPAASERL
jgi:adenylate cyclase